MELQDLSPASGRSRDTGTTKPVTVTNGHGPPETGGTTTPTSRTTDLDLDASKSKTESESALLEKLFQANQQLTLQLAQINHEYEHLHAEKTRHEVSAEQLIKEKDQEHADRVNRLREENSDLQTYLNEYEAKNRELTANLRKSEAVSATLKANAALERSDYFAAQESQKNAHAELERKIQSLEAELKTANERAGANQKEQIRADRTKSDLEQELRSSREEIDELKLRLADSERKQARNLEQVSRLESQYDALQAQLEAAQQTCTSLQGENSSLQEELQCRLRVSEGQGTNADTEFEDDDSPLEYRLGLGHDFGVLDSGDELTRLRTENASLQAQVDAHALASVLEEGNAVLVQQLRGRETELVTQLYEKDQEIERMKEQHEKELEKLKESVEIFGTSYATVFRRLSDAIQVQVQVVEPAPGSEHDAEFAWPDTPILDLDPELHPGEFASGNCTTDNEDEDEKQSQPLGEEIEKSKTDDNVDVKPILVPDSPEPSSSSCSTPVLASAPPAPPPPAMTPVPVPVVLIQKLSPAFDSDDSNYNAELNKIRAAYEMEEQLLASAFYNYGLELYRQASESHNKPTWLDRQRFAKNADYHYKKDESVIPRTNRRFN